VDRWRAVERMLPIHRFGRLQQMRDTRTVAAFSLWEEETFLGRDHLKCTIVVPQEFTKVSRVHAVIRREAGGIVLEDLHSHNGTFLDGRRVDGKAVLKEGAVIALGGAGHSEKETRYVFHRIETAQDDLDTTEDGTKPQTPRTAIPDAADRFPGGTQPASLRPGEEGK
jgi:pSer/pThr/pTyr-binding forkhead associated (FHA) protein